MAEGYGPDRANLSPDSPISCNRNLPLTGQITRAAASVPANIAEGHARSTRRDYANFLAIAKGSLMETETFLMLALRLGYLSKEQATPTLVLITEISKMLTSLRHRPNL